MPTLNVRECTCVCHAKKQTTNDGLTNERDFPVPRARRKSRIGIEVP
nr:hypothetical protein pPsy0479a_00084 [Pseudomonas syringae]